MSFPYTTNNMFTRVVVLYIELISGSTVYQQDISSLNIIPFTAPNQSDILTLGIKLFLNSLQINYINLNTEKLYVRKSQYF